jgi:ABC-type uncharacterized transport system permease subunit
MPPDLPFALVMQLLLILVASLSFLAAFASAVPQLRGAAGTDPHARLRAMYSGIGVGVLLSVIVLTWRVAAEHPASLPLYNYLDAFLVLALILTGVLFYFRWTHHLKGLSLFLLPMIAALLLLGGLLDALNKKQFHDASPWMFIHVVTILLGFACFAAACVCGTVYLLVDRQLRKKGLDPSHRWSGLPPLASMERFMQRAIYLGFPLLTIAIVAGVVWTINHPTPLGNFWTWPKLVLSAIAWLIYSLMLHVKWTPAFRGARAAWLSIVGFVLLLIVFLVVTRG